MKRETYFAFRINHDERRLLTALAERLQRSQSDTVRLIIREAARELITDADQVEHGAPSLQFNQVEVQHDS